MHSRASRAAKGTISARRACETPNRSLMSLARNVPSASAAKQGRVIMDCADGCCGKGSRSGSPIVFARASGPACPAVPALSTRDIFIHALTYRQSARPIALTGGGAGKKVLPEGGRANRQNLRPRLYRLSIEGADGEQNGSGGSGDSGGVGGFGRLHGHGRAGEGRPAGGGGLRAAGGGYAAEGGQASGAAAKHDRLLAAEEGRRLYLCGRCGMQLRLHRQRRRLSAISADSHRQQHRADARDDRDAEPGSRDGLGRRLGSLRTRLVLIGAGRRPGSVGPRILSGTPLSAPRSLGPPGGRVVFVSAAG